MSTSAPRLGFFLVLFSAFAFASKTILAKMCYAYGVSPISILTIRMASAGLIFGSILAVKTISGQWPLNLSRSQWLWAFILGVGAYYLSSFLDFSGLVYVDATLGRMILFLYPTFVIILNFFINKSKIPASTLGALALSYGGIILMMLPNLGAESKNIWLGSLLILTAAVTYALYLIGVERMLKTINPMRFTTLTLSIASIAVLLHYLLAEKSLLKLSELPSNVLLYSCIMGIFSTVLPIYALTAGIKLIGASKAAMISMIGPVLTTIMGIIILDEHLVLIQVVGMFMIIAGVSKVGK